MRSAIYEGTLVHRRTAPKHHFSMRLALPLLDATEVDDVVARHPLWSSERPNVVCHRESDHATPDAVRDRIEQATGRRPGPVATLGHVRTWGWLFDPIALHLCFDGEGDDVVAAVASVTNTPWKEKHDYVLGPPGRHEVDKALHVSPFFGMEQRYVITYSAPGEVMNLDVDVYEDDRRVFGAGLRLRRREIDREALGRLIWRYPLLTMRVSAAIHTQAVHLWRKGARVHRHPGGGAAGAGSFDRAIGAHSRP
jgi:DUF1365 family protein